MNTFPHDAMSVYSSVAIVTHLLILIGRDCDELCLLKHVSAEGALSLLEGDRSIVGLHHVDPRLVFVHRIQDQLQTDKQGYYQFKFIMLAMQKMHYINYNRCLATTYRGTTPISIFVTSLTNLKCLQAMSDYGYTDANHNGIK